MRFHKDFSFKKCLFFLLLSIFILLGGCGQASTSATGESADAESSNATSTYLPYADFLNEIFKEDVTSDTLTLHYTLAHPENYGITDYPVTLGTVSGDADSESLATIENTQDVLHAYNYSALSTEEQLTYDILDDTLCMNEEFSQYPYYEEILSPTSGTQTQLPILLAEYTFYSEKDVTDYLTLLEDVPDYFNRVLTYEQNKSDAGLFMSSDNLDTVINQCQTYADPQNSTYLFDTFESRLSTLTDLSDEQKEAYIQQNQDILTSSVFPAYQALADGLSALRDDSIVAQGLCNYPNGKDYYQLLVKSVTGSDLSIEEMEELVANKRSDDLAVCSDLLAQNSNIYSDAQSATLSLTEPEDMLNDLIEKMSNDFPAAPDTSFTVKTVESSLEDFLSPAFYLSTPIDDTSENSIYINPGYVCDGLDLYTTLAHEGYPGHLYQNLYTKSSGLSNVRYLFSFGGYTEGWATYVEMQAYYYAGLDTDTAEFLQKQRSALLSLYATLDMKIHYDGWTTDDCSDFLSNYGISDTSTIQDIYDYIVMEPGNYLKYYVGYLEFLELREKATSHYKDDFSLSAFHQAILEMGPAPFYILDEYLFDCMDDIL